MKEQIERIGREFFTLMGIELESIAVESEEEKRRIYRVTVKTPDSKLLIGAHGQTLETIRHLLTRLVERSAGKTYLIHLEVNDYLQSKDDRLFRRIDEKIASLMSVWGEITLSELSGYERKKVHAYVAAKAVEGLSTKSTGEGEARVLHLSYSGPVERVHAKSSSLDELPEDGIGI